VRTCLPVFFSAVIFYVNYFILIEKYLFRDKIVLFVLTNILLIALLVYGTELARELWRPVHTPRMWRRVQEAHPISHSLLPRKGYFWIRTAFSLLLTTGVSVAIRATQKWISSEREKRSLENETLKSELSHLRYQLQPHFFFNCLNSIYSLVDSAPDKAKETIHTLSKMMRYVLYETTEERIALSKEILFVKNYIQLMEMRFPRLVNVRSIFPETEKEVFVAPLLFVALVENAFKHGISAVNNSSILIKLQLENSRLIFTTENRNFPKKRDDVSDSGIGLDNLRKRLELIYPGRSVFKQEIIGDMVITNLIIEL
jgi:LytS/YehU family sensor histidine kinase